MRQGLLPTAATVPAMPYTDQDVEVVLALLRPRSCPVRLLRIGGRYDGAYLVPDDLAGVVACFSPGVNNVKGFEDELARRFGLRSHLCDFTSDSHLFQTPLIEDMQTFEKKWLDVNGAPDSISLDEWVAAREPVGDLMLQMDIEGAEFRNLLGCSLETLRRFRVVVLEVHDVQAAASADHQEYFCSTVGELMHRLNREFVVVHAHPNNCCGEVLHGGTGMNLPGAIELTLLRRDRFGLAPGVPLIEPLLPHPDDILRNVADNPPLFLNEHWSDRPRSIQSALKVHDDRIDHLRHLIGRLEHELEREVGERSRTAAASGAGLVPGVSDVPESHEEPPLHDH